MSLNLTMYVPNSYDKKWHFCKFSWLKKYVDTEEIRREGWQGTGTCHLGAAMSTTICSIFSSILAMYFSFLVLGWEKTAKIQKKQDIPKGQPHFLALKIIYGYAAAKMTFDIMRVPVCTLPCHWEAEYYLVKWSQEPTPWSWIFTSPISLSN